jgi:hypothetical protein
MAGRESEVRRVIAELDGLLGELGANVAALTEILNGDGHPAADQEGAPA